MLGEIPKVANPAVMRLLGKLEADENSCDQEMRSFQRERFVLPVQLSTPDKEFQVEAFSRNLTVMGANLITPQPFSRGEKMNLEFNLHELQSKHIVECCWSRRFGKAYWSSGWKFISEQVDMDSVRKADAIFEWEKRTTVRKQYAIPVVIHQDGQKPQVHGFTRNISGSGTCLVTNHEIPEKSCMLQFIRSDGERCDVVAESTWSKKYSERHWMMGWNFPGPDGDAKPDEAKLD